MESLTELAELLRHGTGVRERCRAAAALGRLEAPDAASALVAGLSDSHPRVRVAAARGLRRIGTEDAAEPLLRCLGDSHVGVRQEAAQALVRVAMPDQLPGLEGALGDTDKFVRQQVTRALARLGEAGGLVLQRFATAGGSAWYPRWQAIEALGRAMPDHLQRILAAVLADPEDEIRRWSVDYVGPDSEESVIHAAVALLEDPSSSIRARAARALSVACGLPSVKEGLLRALNDPDPEVLAKSLESLCPVHPPEAEAKVLAFLGHEAIQVREAAATLAGTMKCQAAAPKLVHLLLDSALGPRWRAAEALAAMADTDVLPDILEISTSGSDESRTAAARALAGYHEPEVLAQLLGNLESDSNDLRQTAAASLATVGDTSVLPQIVAKVEAGDLYIARGALRLLVAYAVSEDLMHRLMHGPFQEYFAFILSKCGNARLEKTAASLLPKSRRALLPSERVRWGEALGLEGG